MTQLSPRLEPVTGDPSITAVMVKSSGPNTPVETDMPGAKVVGVFTMTLPTARC